MKCPKCGGENSDGKKFCGECGAALSKSISGGDTDQSSAGPKRTWLSRNWLIIAGIIGVIAIIMIPLVLSYTRPWSGYEVWVENFEDEMAYVAIYIDGKQMAVVNAGPNSGTMAGNYDATPGIHLVGVDFSYNSTADLDGKLDLMNAYGAKILSTKQVVFRIGPQ
ncbi:MAG TPA: zinc ribbon domain-containing protein [Thermoplasmata archaeon]